MASRSWSCTICSRRWIRASLVLRGSENRVKKLSWGSKMLSVFTNSTYLYWGNGVSTARHKASATALTPSYLLVTSGQTRKRPQTPSQSPRRASGAAGAGLLPLLAQILRKTSGKDLCKVTLCVRARCSLASTDPRIILPQLFKVSNLIFSHFSENQQAKVLCQTLWAGVQPEETVIARLYKSLETGCFVELWEQQPHNDTSVSTLRSALWFESAETPQRWETGRPPCCLRMFLEAAAAVSSTLDLPMWKR